MRLLNLPLYPLFLPAYSTILQCSLEKCVSTLSNCAISVAIVIVSFGFDMLLSSHASLLTDQIIGATSDELSAVVRWYYWVQNIGTWFATYYCLSLDLTSKQFEKYI